MAALEGGKHGFAFASGLAAEDTLLRADRQARAAISWCRTTRTAGPSGCSPRCTSSGGCHRRPGAAGRPGRGRGGDHAGGDHRRLGRDARPTRCWPSPTSPPSPSWRTRAGALVIVDNTFASPYLQQPLALGADVVVHSTTKYCGGHSDIVGGALVVNDDDLAEQLRFHQNAMGGVASPFDSWLVLRGLRTLAVRMDRHCDNAEQVAAFLAEHPKVKRGLLPGPAQPSRPRPGQAADDAGSAAWSASPWSGRRGRPRWRCAAGPR